MSENRNPYDEGESGHPCDVVISDRAKWVLTLVFIIGLLVPVFLSLFEKPIQEIGQKRSREFQLRWLAEGNRKVHIGKGGWLYYRPGMESLTGYGPLRTEPSGVKKTPDTKEWKSPLPVIIHFADQLRERGIDLILVPVPDKASVHSISGDDEIRVHPDRLQVFSQLEAAGVQMVDLLPLFEKMRKSGQDVFLKQDTHWHPDAMELAAKEVAAILKKKNLFESERRSFVIATSNRSHIGDLVGMLETSNSSQFKDERVSIDSISIPSGDSPVVLLGDSFVNVFDDPSLGFGKEGEDRINAGFTSHLSVNLGYSVRAFAINGDGSTASRQAFASLPDNVVRSKKQVVWLIAERDIFMSRSTALAADVQWRDVEFNQKTEAAPASTDQLVITARLSEKSRILDPKQVNYPDAIYSAKFDSIKVISGNLAKKDEVIAFLWAFRGKKMLPTADIQQGKVYHLTLLPLLSHPEAKSITQLDDFFDGGTPLFAEKIEEVQ